MRFNKQELLVIASQPSQNFDKEGVLLFKEKQEGFFRRAEVCVPRWFRLRGNLLFYFRGPEQWSEPVGVIVLENHTVEIQNQDENGQWPFQIVFGGGGSHKMATYTEYERSDLVKYLSRACFVQVKSQLSELQVKLSNRHKASPLHNADIKTWRLQKRVTFGQPLTDDLLTDFLLHIEKQKAFLGLNFDLNEVPLCELALSCDNLLCSPLGLPPSPMIIIHIKYPNGKLIQYANTEVIESCSNPTFSKTIMFRGSDGLTGDTLLQIAVYNIIEKMSQTYVPLGFAKVLLSTVLDTTRLRINLNSRDHKITGFITINAWCLESTSTNSSPKHTNGPNSMDIPQKMLCHKRSHSLPPRLGVKLKLPVHGTIIKCNFANICQESYRFHSGLGGDIAVHEIMAESKLCFSLPIQLLTLYMQREMELLQEILYLGELDEKWKSRQIYLLNTHLYLLQQYSHAIQTMRMYLHTNNGKHFKESSKKGEAGLEFAPVNLHLQRMWAYNDTLNKCGFHDIITVGAFATHIHKNQNPGGLLRLVQQMKDVSTKESLNSPNASRIQMASDAVQAIKQLRKEIFNIMEKLLALAKLKQSSGMIQLAEEMVTRTRTLLTLWDPGLMEEVLAFIEWHKVPVNEKPSDGIQTNAPFQQFTQHLSLLELCNHDLLPFSKFPDKESQSTVHLPQLFQTTPVNSIDKSSIASSSIQLSSTASSLDNENVKLQFLNDHFEHGCENNATDVGTSNEFNSSDNKQNVYNESCDFTSKLNLDDFSSLHLIDLYQNSEDPEPWDLTQLNIEASVMCLVSKVKFLCGRRGSPAVRLRHQKTKDSICIGKQSMSQQSSLGNLKENMTTNINKQSRLMNTLTDTDNAVVAAVDSVKKLVKKGNKFTEGLKLDEVKDWSEELQPSMKKLKQAMDGLLKTGRLAHSVLRLKGEDPHRTRAMMSLQMRRDTCFSQALTAVTTGLMCWLWTSREDFVVTLLTSGLTPLCGFEGLLSLYDSESAMWGDMVVAIEDLQTVLFTLTKINHSTNIMPTITGSRCTLVVLIPVPDSLYSKFCSKEHLSFTITPVFFNIGINDKATLAEQVGDTMPQEQSNTDNFDRLNKYYNKYKKIFPNDPTSIRRSSSRVKSLEEVIENLRTIVHKKIPRNYEILQLAALATRYMNGVRMTSCKSAKDRTGMSATLEQCTILASEYHLAEHEFSKALDGMRSEGCRRENTVKNIGIRKYAFAKIQCLPKDYRPPTGTYGSTQT